MQYLCTESLKAGWNLCHRIFQLDKLDMASNNDCYVNIWRTERFGYYSLRSEQITFRKVLIIFERFCIYALNISMRSRTVHIFTAHGTDHQHIPFKLGTRQVARFRHLLTKHDKYFSFFFHLTVKRSNITLPY